MFHRSKHLKIKGKILLFSDLHVGFFSNFKREDAFFDWIESVIDKYDYIISNGDFLELWRYSKNTWRASESEKKIELLIKKYPKILKFLENGKFIFVIGNHDFAMLKYFKNNKKVKIFDSIYNKKLDFYITHGHQVEEYDNEFLEKNTKIPWSLIILDYLILKIYNLLGWDRLKGDKILSGIEFSASQSEEIFEKLVLKMEYKNVILGHTHRFGYKKVGGKNYYNTGSCLEKIQVLEIDAKGRFNFLEVEYE